MPPSPLLPDLTVFTIQELSALLFCLVFLFLYRQSEVVYFGLWSIAWLLRFLAALFGYELRRTASAGWLAPYATFEFAFVILLISAARAGFASGIKDWRTVLRLIAILPIFVALVWGISQYAGLQAYDISDALVLATVYFYNFAQLHRQQGIGSRVFRFSLLMLAGAFFFHALLLVYLYRTGPPTVWARYVHNEAYYDFALHCVLAFAAMGMWSESQIERVRELGSELDKLRRDATQSRDLDRLTGLLNQAALALRVESPLLLNGVVVVCDMDNFKEVNDCYGHLVGDEILRHIGNLLKASIRKEDEAFRWGGDEFVILFQNQCADVAEKRMGELELRLHDFRVRGFGVLPIGFSWGAAELAGRSLRDALDEADHNMYARKRMRGVERAGR
jgi:diguanylate cyclase (GGDEF)-like protein